MIKISSTEYINTYVNENRIVSIETFTDSGYETTTMKKVKAYIIVMYLDDGTFVKIETYSKKQFAKDIEYLDSVLLKRGDSIC